MDPRHDPRKIKARREAAKEERERKRMAGGRRKNAVLLASIEGAVFAEMMGVGRGTDKEIISLAKTYLEKGLPMSERSKKTLDERLESGCLEEVDETEFIVDLLRGSVGLLSSGLKLAAYALINEYECKVSISGEQRRTMASLLERALGRGDWAFRG